MMTIGRGENECGGHRSNDQKSPSPLMSVSEEFMRLGRQNHWRLERELEVCGLGFDDNRAAVVARWIHLLSDPATVRA